MVTCRVLLNRRTSKQEPQGVTPEYAGRTLRRHDATGEVARGRGTPQGLKMRTGKCHMGDVLLGPVNPYRATNQQGAGRTNRSKRAI